MSRRWSTAGAGVLAGLVTLALFLGVAELVAVATGPDSAPGIAIGQNVIAHTPESLKQFAIEHFGENDKNALLAGIYTMLAVASGLVGAVALLTRRVVAAVAVAALGIVAAISAATQPAAGVVDAVPSLVAGALGAGAFMVLTSRRWERYRRTSSSALPPTPPTEPIAGAGISRRRLLVGGSLVAFGAAAYLVGRSAISSVYNAAASRAAVRLPRPRSSSPETAGTGFDVSGLPGYITPDSEFYRVDTALVIPQIATQDYRLRIHGMVDHPATYSFDDLLAMPMIERTITMVCVSNPVGGPYLGNARWLGVPLADLLGKAGVRSGADQLFMTSSDGMTIGADLAAAMDGRPAMLAVGMNGQPLPFKHGFPVRAVIPGIYGYASACKWLVDMEITTYAAKTAYWVQRGYAQKAPVKLESKIDTPASFANLRPGTVSVAGSAWHPTVGISKVEVSVDGGQWHRATLGAVESLDSWQLWHWEWRATPGTHRLQVRATDRNGTVQTPTQTSTLPNGASGRESIVVTVS